jgi:ABC-2 type transport system ATP-binding protein
MSNSPTEIESETYYPPTDNNDELVVEAKQVYKSFKTVKAVKGVDLRIRKGRFVALLGPNGAGKTTLVEMVEGIQKPDSGEILIMGKHWKGNENELHYSIGLSLQDTRFIDKLTVKETLKLFASFYNLDKKRIDDIIRMVGLEDKTTSYVINLSGGQRQKLALGIALLNNPRILLLDEPTTGLDPVARREVWAILMNLKKQMNTSLILTTHYMEEAERLCDYIIIIDKGEILQEGTLEQLLDEESNEKIIEFTVDNTFDGIEKIFSDSPFKIEWGYANQKGTIKLKKIETELVDFINFVKQNKLQLKNLLSRKKTLDDLFTSLTGRHLHEENHSVETIN